MAISSRTRPHLSLIFCVLLLARNTVSQSSGLSAPSISGVSLSNDGTKIVVTFNSETNLGVSVFPSVTTGILGLTSSSLTTAAMTTAQVTSSEFTTADMTTASVTSSEYTTAAEADSKRAVYTRQHEIRQTTGNGVPSSLNIAFSCSLLINTTKLGANPQCVWTDNTHLQISLGAGATIIVGDVLVFIAPIRAKGGVYDSPSFNGPTTGVTAPSQAVKPSAVIVVPTEISSCLTNLSVSISSPSGSAGRDLSYSWIYGGLVISNSPTKVTLNTTNLDSGSSHNVTLTVTNWLKQSTNVSAEFKITDLAIPTITLPYTTLTVTSDKAFQIPATVVLPPCVNASAAKITYKWTAMGQSIPVPSANKSVLSVPAFAVHPLVSPISTTISVNVTVGTSTTSANATVDVVVPLRSPVALIAGGNRDVTNGTAFTLNASSSYDPDALAMANGAFATGLSKAMANNINYTWTCVGPAGAGCPEIPLGNSAPSITLHTLGVYTFTVTVYRNLVQSSFSDASVSVNVVATPVLPVSITSQSGLKINSKDRLVLGSSITNASSPTYLWSLAPSDVTLGSTNILAGFTSSAFIVRPNTLNAGSSYTFKLSASDRGVNGTSSITIAVNSVPALGSVSADLTQGTALLTTFTLTANAWVDPDAADGDGPLTYQFFITDSTGVDFPLSKASTANSVSVTIPKTGNQTVKVVVTDSFGGQGSAVGTVINITEASASQSKEIADAGLKNIESLASSGDSEAVTLAVASLAQSPAVLADPTVTSKLVDSLVASIDVSDTADVSTDLLSTGASVVASLAGGNLSDDSVAASASFLSNLGNALDRAVGSGVLSPETANAILSAGSALIKNLAARNSTTPASRDVENRDISSAISNVMNSIYATASVQVKNRQCGENAVTSTSEGATITTYYAQTAEDNLNLGENTTVLFANSAYDGSTCYKFMVFTVNYIDQSSLNSTESARTGITVVTTEPALALSNTSRVTISLPIRQADTNSAGGLRENGCRFRSTTGDSWESDDTCVVVSSDANTITCDCSHLTEFQGYSKNGTVPVAATTSAITSSAATSTGQATTDEESPKKSKTGAIVGGVIGGVVGVVIIIIIIVVVVRASNRRRRVDPTPAVELGVMRTH